MFHVQKHFIIFKDINLLHRFVICHVQLTVCFSLYRTVTATAITVKPATRGSTTVYTGTGEP